MKPGEARTESGAILRVKSPTIKRYYLDHPDLMELNRRYTIPLNSFQDYTCSPMGDIERFSNGLGRIYKAFRELCPISIEDLENHVTFHFAERGIPLLREFERLQYLTRSHIYEGEPEIRVEVDLPTEFFLKSMDMRPYVAPEHGVD